MLYGIGSERMADRAMLEPNHPYALLVTNGTEKSPSSNFQPADPGAEIELRCAIEHELSSRNITHSSSESIQILDSGMGCDAGKHKIYGHFGAKLRSLAKG